MKVDLKEHEAQVIRNLLVEHTNAYSNEYEVYPYYQEILDKFPKSNNDKILD